MRISFGCGFPSCFSQCRARDWSNRNRPHADKRKCNLRCLGRFRKTQTSGTCAGNLCKCANNLFTFTVTSNVGGAFDSAEWPGGQTSQSSATGCGVTINRPNDNIDLVCSLAAPFSVASFSGFSSCVGTGGEDGDGCAPLSCPFAGVGSCCDGRPSCSVATNGSGSANYFVQCLQ